MTLSSLAEVIGPDGANGAGGETACGATLTDGALTCC